jgi:hypothetical protein
MARDAIARQYDVDKNRVLLLSETDKGSYRPGTITFFPKKGKTLDLRKMVESITATRLSGGTGMSMNWLEITATGEVVLDGKTVLLKVSGTRQQFVLKEAAEFKNKGGTATPLLRLCAAVDSGAKVVSVTGRVDGWSGGFPVVMRALAKRPPDEPVVLFVTGFETSKK